MQAYGLHAGGPRGLTYSPPCYHAANLWTRWRSGASDNFWHDRARGCRGISGDAADGAAGNDRGSKGRMSGEQLKPPTCKICKGQRRRENAAGKFNRQLGKYPGKISGASQSAIFGIMENARGLEAVSRANSWLFAGPGIGTNYLSIGRHCVGRVTPWCRTISRVNYISAAPKNCFVAA
jgi:hypothetical protein